MNTNLWEVEAGNYISSLVSFTNSRTINLCTSHYYHMNLCNLLLLKNSPATVSKMIKAKCLKYYKRGVFLMYISLLGCCQSDCSNKRRSRCPGKENNLITLDIL